MTTEIEILESAHAGGLHRPSERGAASPRQAAATLAAHYHRVRSLTVSLTAPLSIEDHVIQSMPDASPTKWHLAHTTWFFETFVLSRFLPNHRAYQNQWQPLFNSYYQSIGPQLSRAQRGLLSRPTVAEIHDYRKHIDDAIQQLVASDPGDNPDLAFLLTLGLNHEQQHQELLLTDIKHLLFTNPMHPAYDPGLPSAPYQQPTPLKMLNRDSGTYTIGADPQSFCFDNETPRHDVSLRPHALANRLVANEDFAEFIRNGGYRNPAYWLADGWAMAQEQGWNKPLYWSGDGASEYTLGGWRALNPAAPVTHVSYYEADAFARWCGARLPSEAEWEVAAAEQAVAGNFLESGLLHPAPPAASGNRASALYGDVWEWTASPYLPYPGFVPLAGSLGEYNGKFMCNQITVRGGSCVASRDHLRASYRSFFYPHQRWQFLGFRLARDA